MKKHPYAPLKTTEPLLTQGALKKLQLEARMALLGKKSKVCWPPFFLLAMQRADAAAEQLEQEQAKRHEAVKLAREENERIKAEAADLHQRHASLRGETQELRRKYNALLEGKNERVRAIAELTDSTCKLRQDLEQEAAEAARLRAQLKDVLRATEVPNAILCTQHRDVVRIKHPEDGNYLAIKQGDRHIAVEARDNKGAACFMPISKAAALTLHRHLGTCIDNWPKD